MPEPEVDVAALYLAGVPFVEIERRCGHTARWVYTRMERVGVAPGRDDRHFFDVSKDPFTREIRKLWLLHGSIKHIARITGRSRLYVKRRLPREVLKHLKRISTSRKKARKTIRVVSPRNLVSGNERRRMKCMFDMKVPIKEIARRLNRCEATIFDHVHGRRSKKRPKPMRWPKPFETPEEAYHGQFYEDVPVKIGALAAAIIAGRHLRDRAFGVA